MVDTAYRIPHGYANAVLRGRTDIFALLTELGASTELSAGDRAVAALARGERPDGPLPRATGLR